MGPAAQSVACQPEITMNYGKLLARLSRVDVLVVDDWALSPPATATATTCSR